MSLGRELKNLQSFEVRGLKWKVKVVQDFLLSAAENLQSFSCEVKGLPMLFQVGDDFLRKLKSSDSPMEILQQFIIDDLQVRNDEFINQ